MKLFYPPVVHLLLSIDEPLDAAKSKWLRLKAWDIWEELDANEPWLTNKEARLLNHLYQLLQITEKAHETI